MELNILVLFLLVKLKQMKIFMVNDFEFFNNKFFVIVQD